MSSVSSYRGVQNEEQYALAPGAQIFILVPLMNTLTRRQFLGRSAVGLGTAALAAGFDARMLGAEPEVPPAAPMPFLIAKSGSAPWLCVTPDGGVLLVYRGAGRDSADQQGLNDLYFTKAPHVGAAFSPPLKVATFTRLISGMRREPRVASDGRTLLITGMEREGFGIQAFRSEDGGRTWSAPVRVNSPEAKLGEGLYTMSGSPSGSFHVAWLDDRVPRATQIWHARSSDGGRTWQERKAFPAGDGRVCECCWPALAAGPEGRLFLLVRHNLQNVRDMHMVESSDDGVTWSASRKLGARSWTIAACPVQGGAMDVLADGVPAAIWSREGEMFSSGMGSDEKLLGKGRNGAIAAGPDGAYFLWEESPPQSSRGDIHIARPDGRVLQFRPQPPQGGPYATSSTIAGHPRAGVVAAWQENGGIYGAVLSTPNRRQGE